VVEKIRERLVVCKQVAQKFYAEIFNLNKLSDLEVNRYSIPVQAWRGPENSRSLRLHI
jgi:hypothetical protein